MCVDTNFFAGTLHRLTIAVVKLIDLFTIEITEAVDDHHRASRCGCNLLEHRVDFRFFENGDRHQIGHCFIAHIVAVMNHLDCFRNLVSIECNSDHVEYAFVARTDLVFPVAFAGIGHGRQFESCGFTVMIADNAPHVFLITMSPITKIIFWKYPC